MNNSAKIIKDMIGRDSIFETMIKMIFIPIQFAANKIYAPTGQENSKKILIFNNLQYTGNPRAVYERILKTPELLKKYEIYWLANDLRTFFRLRAENKPVLYKHGILSIKKYRNANLWILAHLGMWNLPTIMHGEYARANKIHLGHGVGPKATKGEEREYNLYDAVCLSSEFIKQRHIELWNAPPEKLRATGFARIDIIKKYMDADKRELLSTLNLPAKYDKIVLLAPTFDMGIWPWGEPISHLKKLAEYLDSKNAMLLIRPHPYAQYDRRQFKKFVRAHHNVVFAPMSKYPDTQMLLAITDVLITDWSSIYTDFLVTRRPIIFLEVNSKFFLEERGKPEVPPELRPGIKVKTERDFYSGLKKVLQENYIPDTEFYEKCLRLIHGEPDGHYSDRVIEVIEDVLR